MSTPQTIRDRLAEIDPDVLCFDGFDDALIGFSQRCGEPVVAVYAYNKLIDILCERDGADAETAAEFVAINVVGAWLGPRTPVVVEYLDTVRVAPNGRDTTEGAAVDRDDESPQ